MTKRCKRRCLYSPQLSTSIPIVVCRMQVHADVATVFAAALYSSTAFGSRGDASGRSRASPGGAGDVAGRARRSGSNTEGSAQAAAATAVVQGRCMKLLEVFIGSAMRCSASGKLGGGLLGLGPVDAALAATAASAFSAPKMDKSAGPAAPEAVKSEKQDGTTAGPEEVKAKLRREASEDKLRGSVSNIGGSGVGNTSGEVAGESVRRGPSERRRRPTGIEGSCEPRSPPGAVVPTASTTRRRVSSAAVAASAPAGSPCASEKGSSGADTSFSPTRVRTPAGAPAALGAVATSGKARDGIQRRSVAARRSVGTVQDMESMALASEEGLCPVEGVSENRDGGLGVEVEKAPAFGDSSGEIATAAEAVEAGPATLKAEEEAPPQLEAAPQSRKRTRPPLPPPSLAAKQLKTGVAAPASEDSIGTATNSRREDRGTSPQGGSGPGGNPGKIIDEEMIGKRI